MSVLYLGMLVVWLVLLSEVLSHWWVGLQA